MIISLAINIFLSILMAVTIYYCWKLNKYLEIIRDSRSELARVINDFSIATNRAQATVSEIRQSSEIIADKLQIKIEKAEFIADDLAYIMDKANKVSDSLGQKVADIMPAKPKSSSKSDIIPEPAASSTRAKPEPARAQQSADSKEASAKPRSKAEMELLQALKSIK